MNLGNICSVANEMYGFSINKVFNICGIVKIPVLILPFD